MTFFGFYVRIAVSRRPLNIRRFSLHRHLSGDDAGRGVVDGHVRSTLLAVKAPGFEDDFRWFDRVEPANVQALVAHRTAEGLDEDVAGRFAGSAGVNSSAMMIGPDIHQARRGLAAVIGKHRQRSSSLHDEPAQRGHYVFAMQAQNHIEGHCLAREHVHDCQRADLGLIAQFVRNEIQASCVIHHVECHAMRASRDEVVTSIS